MDVATARFVYRWTSAVSLARVRCEWCLVPSLSVRGVGRHAGYLWDKAFARTLERHAAFRADRTTFTRAHNITKQRKIGIRCGARFVPDRTQGTIASLSQSLCRLLLRSVEGAESQSASGVRYKPSSVACVHVLWSKKAYRSSQSSRKTFHHLISARNATS